MNRDTGEELRNLGRVDINVNSFGKVTLSVEFKDIQLKLEAEVK